MSALTDHCTVVRQWMNWGAEEYTDALITTFTRMGEEKINEKLRIADMVVTSAPLTIVAGTATFPDDWLESDFVRIIGGGPLSYKSRADFYTPNAEGIYENSGKFTTIGRDIFVASDVVTDTQLEVSYFATVPPLDNATWLSLKYPSLNLMATLMFAGMYYIEDERTAAWATFVDNKVNELNGAYKMAQPSGARLNAKSKRSFG